MKNSNKYNIAINKQTGKVSIYQNKYKTNMGKTIACSLGMREAKKASILEIDAQ